jgi:hypothetical protein
MTIARKVQVCDVGGGQEPRHAHVYAGLPARSRHRHKLGLGNVDHIPAAVLPLDLQRLRRVCCCAVNECRPCPSLDPTAKGGSGGFTSSLKAGVSATRI